MSGFRLGFKFLFCLFLLFLFVPTSALAGGLYLEEFLTPSMGTADAGSAAVANDASTAFHNAAGMTRVGGYQLMVCTGVLATDVKFKTAPDTPVAGGNGGDAGGFIPAGSVFLTHKANDDTYVGFSLLSFSGAVLDYDSDWAGRYQTQKVDLFTITLSPSVAYRLNDRLSVSAGAGFVIGKLEEDIAIQTRLAIDGKATLDGEDAQVGYKLGALYELSDQTRMGIVYWSGVDFDFSGDLKLDRVGAEVGAITELPLPQYAKASFYHQVNDAVALLGTIGWEDWSQMDETKVSLGAGNISGAIPRNWEDTWHYAGGIHYRVSDPWLLRCGIAYDTSPVSAEDRTADMPVDRQVRYAVGATYTCSDSLDIGTEFEYIDMGSGKINGKTLIGEYDNNNVYIFAMNFNWKF